MRSPGRAAHASIRTLDAMTSFHCKTCGLLLADGLSECREDALCLEDGMPMLPPKTFCVSEGKHPPEVAGDYLINVDELVNARLYVESRGRLNGCCGLDGLDGINHVCQNGHEAANRHHYRR